MWKYKGFVSDSHKDNLEGLSYFRIPYELTEAFV